MKKYVLKTDERMPSKSNLWGIEAGSSPEEAKSAFRRKIEGWHSSSKFHHLLSMEEDRKRRLREDDFDVELL
jgi:hypothetical protein